MRCNTKPQYINGRPADTIDLTAIRRGVGQLQAGPSSVALYCLLGLVAGIALGVML